MARVRTRADIAADYQAARASQDGPAMARFQNEEACLVLLTVLQQLAADPKSFIHRVAIKGGILMAGELRSPRASADIDATSGLQKRLDVEEIVREIRAAGREFNIRQDREPERTSGGSIVHLRFDSLTDAGTAKIEVSVREDLVFAVRDAVFGLADIGLEPFSIPALAKVELVAEKLRALVQRAQPRDLFDLRLYLVESGWHLDPKELRACVDQKLALTKYKRWRTNLWRMHLDEIEPLWDATLTQWVHPDRIPSFAEAVAEVSGRLHELRLD
jgi:predicted nucleotidyltransferase component of viral defense system